MLPCGVGHSFLQRLAGEKRDNVVFLASMMTLGLTSASCSIRDKNIQRWLRWRVLPCTIVSGATWGSLRWAVRKDVQPFVVWLKIGVWLRDMAVYVW